MSRGTEPMCSLVLSEQVRQEQQVTHLKRLLAWQTLPRAVYSILKSRLISHDRLNSFSGSGVMDSMAFLMAGMKNNTCMQM